MPSLLLPRRSLLLLLLSTSCDALKPSSSVMKRFDAMLEASWSAVAPGGVLFTRLASAIGIEMRVEMSVSSPNMSVAFSRRPSTSARAPIDFFDRTLRVAIERSETAAVARAAGTKATSVTVARATPAMIGSKESHTRGETRVPSTAIESTHV